MDRPMEEFLKVGKIGKLRPGEARLFQLRGERVAVFRAGRGYVAVSDLCPHQGASLTEDGFLKDGLIECLRHGWKFDPETGRSDSRTGGSLEVYGVRVRKGEVYLKPPEREEASAVPDPGDDEEWMGRDIDSFFRKRDADE
jgi:nitrite reductase/ring-hydroxylating ferredoxin subunit